MPILKELNAEAHVGPPVWADRAKGYNYVSRRGLYDRLCSDVRGRSR
jgi:hypothetical protein